MDGLIERTVVSEYIYNAVARYAPILASTLISPLAGVGLSMLGSLLNVNANDQQAIKDKIDCMPDFEIKVKELELNNQQLLLRIMAQNYEVEVDDRKSARMREIQTHDNVPKFLAIGFLVVYALIQCYCAFYPISNNDIISARLQDILVMIISYYFGSSYKEKSLQ